MMIFLESVPIQTKSEARFEVSPGIPFTNSIAATLVSKRSKAETCLRDVDDAVVDWLKIVT